MSFAKGDILCMGNALLDLTFFADKTFVDAHDLKPNGACKVDSDRFKTLLENLEARFNYTGQVPGGASQNTARTLQWLLPCPTGFVNYLGATCTDRFGTMLLEKAKAAGLNAVYETVDEATGCCLVIVSGDHNENRSLVAFPGGATRFSLDFLKKNWSFVEQAKIVYTEGYFLPTCFDSCLEVGKHIAGTTDRKFALHLSAPYIATEFKDRFVQLLPYIDYLFGNEAEFLAFGRTMGWGEDLKTVMRKIATFDRVRSSFKRVVCCTQHDKPVLLCEGDASVLEFSVPEVTADHLVDRNGCGDAFVGGFLANLYRGKSLNECVRMAINTSHISMGHMGCTFPAEKPCLDKLSA